LPTIYGLIGRFDRFYRRRAGRDFVPVSQAIFALSGAEPAFPVSHCRHRSGRCARPGGEGKIMLSWVVTFLVIALIAGVLGFGGIAGASVEIAKAIFFIAIVLFLISAVVGLVRGRTRV
jgi:uncharacterized membrane protein YtjA (UPF0391 family)